MASPGLSVGRKEIAKGLEVSTTGQVLACHAHTLGLKPLAAKKLDTLAYNCNPSILRVEAGGSEIQSHLWLHHQLEASLGCVRSCLNNKRGSQGHGCWPASGSPRACVRTGPWTEPLPIPPRLLCSWGCLRKLWLGAPCILRG